MYLHRVAHMTGSRPMTLETGVVVRRENHLPIRGHKGVIGRDPGNPTRVFSLKPNPQQFVTNCSPAPEHSL